MGGNDDGLSTDLCHVCSAKLLQLFTFTGYGTINNMSDIYVPSICFRKLLKLLFLVLFTLVPPDCYCNVMRPALQTENNLFLLYSTESNLIP